MRSYLKKIRREKKLTQVEISEKLGVSQNYYSYIESGVKQRDMNLSFVFKLSNVFDVSVNYILEEEQKLQSAS